MDLNTADSVYARRAWNQWLNGPGSKYRDTPGFAVNDVANGPNQMAGERLVTDRLVAAIEQQAPTPQRVLFRPRFGRPRVILGIEDIIDVDDIYRVPRTPNDANPGGPAEINSSSSPTFVNDLGRA